jgi:hypothetical protein
LSAVDFPPGIGLVGTALGRFRSPAPARRLTKRAFALCVICAVVTWITIARRYNPSYPGRDSTFAVVPLALCGVATLGYLIRTASVSVGRDGVRWGWSWLSFTRQAERIVRVGLYQQGVEIAGRRGSPWFLAARDWADFPEMTRQLQRSGMPVAQYTGPAPWRSRMQSYGAVLDALLILATLGSVVVMLVAVGR